MKAGMLVASSLLMLTSLSGISASQDGSASGPPSASGGVNIRGHWTLTIRDDIGPGASVHSFDNHFVGHESLAKLLLGVAERRGWALVLHIVGPDGEFLNCLSPSPASPIACVVREGDYSPAIGLSGLRVGGDATSLVLSGTFQSAGAGTVQLAYSALNVCVDDLTRPDNGCDSSPFTEREFFKRFTPPPADAIVVKARQRIDVTLRITAR